MEYCEIPPYSILTACGLYRLSKDAHLLEYFAIIQRPFNIVWSFVHF